MAEELELGWRMSGLRGKSWRTKGPGSGGQKRGSGKRKIEQVIQSVSQSMSE